MVSPSALVVVVVFPSTAPPALVLVITRVWEPSALKVRVSLAPRSMLALPSRSVLIEVERPLPLTVRVEVDSSVPVAE